MQKKKFNLSGPAAFLIALLVLAVFVPINLIVNYYDTVMDMTPAGKYTLSEKTTELLDESSDTHIDVYFLSKMSELEESISSYPAILPLYHTLTELDKRDNITLTTFDPDEDADLAQELDPNGVYTLQSSDIIVKANGITKHISRDKLLQVDSNGIQEYAGEELIAGAISICTSGSLPKVYFLTGYSDKTIENTYSGFAEEIETDNYTVEGLDLSSVDSVPDDTAIIYLAGPDRDISAADREKLSDYIDNGGSISMLLPPSGTEGRFTNIEYLLAKFELGMDYNELSEQNSVNQLLDNDSVQNPGYFRVSYPTRNEDYSEDLTTDINTLITNGVYTAGISHPRSFAALSSNSEMIEKASIIENLPTAQDSYEYTTLSTPTGGDSDTAEAAEALTAQPVTMGWYAYNKQNGSKLILVGTDEIISDYDITIPTYGTRMLVLFSNTWLFDSDVSVGIGNKSNSYDTMQFADSDEATSALRIFTVVPIALALCGVAVWLKRRYA